MMNYGDLKADNEPILGLGGRKVQNNEKFQGLYAEKFSNVISAIFEMDEKSLILFRLHLDKILNEPQKFNNSERHFLLILKVADRYLMIKELVEKESKIGFGVFGVLLYLGLTCFDSLGQKNEYITFQDWLNKKDGKVDELELLIRNFPEKGLREELKELYDKYYNPEFGVKQSFFNFLNLIKEKESYEQLLLGIDLSKFVLRQIKYDSRFIERFKKDWLFYFRNNFTHNTENLRIPLENANWLLSYKRNDKTFHIWIRPNKIITNVLSCIKDGIEIKMTELGFSLKIEG
ncbi:hypothetical protein GM418_04985 [Maribellus comscasis]|uniref:Uncharacterized protein n=1 Tax=Maribellus comscasis TaxID=2681766 RepID=A0A6I6JJJ0_9BACT|nr:hypothetical protein [Maribellus comscasis]QGY43035.1 hypothetical protein GM418_04985 [Maribellus comscasis]